MAFIPFVESDQPTMSNFNQKLSSIDEAKQQKFSVQNLTLTASGWTGDGPYNITVAVPGVTGDSANVIIPAINITSSQLEALQNANVQDVGQKEDSITLRAFGDKPSVNIPVRIVVWRED